MHAEVVYSEAQRADARCWRRSDVRATWLLVISYKRFLKMAAFVTAPTTITILALHGCLLCRCVPAAWGPELLRRASREWPHIPL